MPSNDGSNASILIPLFLLPPFDSLTLSPFITPLTHLLFLSHSFTLTLSFFSCNDYDDHARCASSKRFP